MDGRNISHFNVVNMTFNESINDNHQMMKYQSLGHLGYRDKYLMSVIETQIKSHNVALHVVNVSLIEDRKVLKYFSLDLSIL